MTTDSPSDSGQIGEPSDAFGRRQFLVRAGQLTTVALASGGAPGAQAAEAGDVPTDAMGVLVDLTACVGCRLCEYACRNANGDDSGPLEAYDDQSVFAEPRRPGPDALTVINAWPVGEEADRPVYAKINCMHCHHAACVSACIVGALRKQDTGAVTYDADRCIGCRYCMVACPFQIPAYEYGDTLTPKVRKCEFCFDAICSGSAPACVNACPRQALRYGRRNELVRLAHERIVARPGAYFDHVYGEREVGGTCWLYLSPVPFEDVGFLALGDVAPPALSEAIQHGVFKYGLLPSGVAALLGGIMAGTSQRRIAAAEPVAAERKGPIEAPCPDGAAQPAVTPVAFLSPGAWVLVVLACVGAAAALLRFVAGLGPVTNLDQQHPWGLWIAVDVASGVALAAGGFTVAALTHVFHRQHYEAIARPALLTAMLGYTFVALGLQVDLGRYYNVWHPLIMWQGNSVLFEVGMCVMCYLTVLYLEFAPILCERLQQAEGWPRIRRAARRVRAMLNRIMFALVIAGVVLSCLHQSSLGTLLVIAPSKLHPLWWTPILPLLFLLSAVAVGFPMVIWESLFVSWSLKREAEMHVLRPLARYIPVFLGAYLLAKVVDLVWRRAYVHLAELTPQSVAYVVETGLGVVLPLVMLLDARVRRSPRLVFSAASLVVLGVVLNRVNVFLVGYQPPYAVRTYLPSIGEIAVTCGLVALLMLVYRLIVMNLPVLGHGEPEGGGAR
ncbi:MAG: Ni/Fe-hydrogenase cytochrome b subunit [Phycisphaeraceae bacterium]|nr:Ni/Fe-hydrogenase cytochrome b subunit [Phycisphaeraceae bacterium]